jgi:hypothetical protein
MEDGDLGAFNREQFLLSLTSAEKQGQGRKIGERGEGGCEIIIFEKDRWNDFPDCSYGRRDDLLPDVLFCNEGI